MPNTVTSFSENILFSSNYYKCSILTEVGLKPIIKCANSEIDPVVLLLAIPASTLFFFIITDGYALLRLLKVSFLEQPVCFRAPFHL